MDRRSNLWSFIVLCVIWGSTWLGIKAGLDAVPPFFLAGSRFFVAGAVLIAFSVAREGGRLRREDWGRVLAASFLLIAVCSGALFWGMVYVDSGTGAVLELGLTPVALLGFALLLKEERATTRSLLAIALGIAGLALLFGPMALDAWGSADGAAGPRVAGAAAVAFAAVTYGWGSVVARPLLRRYTSTLISGATTLLGGAMLLVLSFATETGATRALRGDWGAAAWAGWLFLVIFGSLIGYSIYMRLLRDIGASRAGMYAFVSPVFAVLLGAVVRDETVTVLDVLGMVVLLGAAWLALSGGRRAGSE